MKNLLILLFLLFAMSCQQPVQQKYDYLFVGTYTQKEGHVDGKASGIYVLKFYTETAEIEVIDTISGITNPSFIDYNPATQSLYAVSEVSDTTFDNAGWVYHFPYQPQSGVTGKTSRFSSLGAYPCFVEANSQEIMIANYMGGNIVFYPLDSMGNVIDQPDSMQHIGSGPTSRQEAPHAHSIRKSPGNGLYYAADLGTDEIMVYEKTATSLVLKNKWPLPPGSGPRHLEFHPELPLIFIINELSGSIITFDLDRSAIIQEITYLSLGEVNASGADIHISPDAQFLYVSNRDVHNEIVIFSLSETGKLTMVDRVKLKGNTPRNFAIHPNGKYLLAAGQDSSTLEVYEINTQTGELTFKSITNIPTPVCLVFVAGKEQ